MVNLLKLVLPAVNNVVDPSAGEFEVSSLVGQVRNALGVMVPTYGPSVRCHGSVQPVSRSRYADQGLDFAKNYIQVWGSIEVKDLTRATQPDRITWMGRTYTVVSIDEWNPHDGWMHCQAVEDVRER